MDARSWPIATLAATRGSKPRSPVRWALLTLLCMSCAGDHVGRDAEPDAGDASTTQLDADSVGDDTAPAVWTTTGSITFSDTLFPPPWGAVDMTVRLMNPSGLGPVFAEQVISIDDAQNDSAVDYALSAMARPPGDLLVTVSVRSDSPGDGAGFGGSAMLPADTAGTDVVVDQADFDEAPFYCGDDPLSPAERACVYEFVWRFAASNPAFLEAKGVDWDAEYDAHRSAALNAPSDAEFYRRMARMVVALEDHHWIYVGLPLVEELMGCPSMGAVLYDGRIYVSGTAPLPAGVAAGDEIVSIDGAAASARVAEASELYSDHHARRFEALSRSLLLCGPLDSDAVVVVSTSDGPLSVAMKRDQLLDLVATISGPSLSVDALIVADELQGAGGPIAYVRVASFSHPDVAATFDDAFEPFREAAAVIVDVRGNSGGLIAQMHAIAGRFLGDELSPHVLVGPDSAVTPVTVSPTGAWQYAGPVIVLTDETSYSASSMFASIMRSRGATLVGRPTGGGTSPIHFNRYQPTTLSYLGTSSAFYYDLEGDGVTVDLFGVVPDHAVPLLLEDVVSGAAYRYGAPEDAILSKALELLATP